jgi:hypothetical protein
MGKVFFLVALALLATPSCESVKVSTQFDSREYSYYGGRQYEFRLTDGQVRDTPTWDPKQADHPPLAAAEALQIAERFIAALPKRKGTFWSFEELALRHLYGQHWAWKAEFRHVASIVSTGPPVTMQCWMLMDGTVIQPRVRKDDRWD